MHGDFLFDNIKNTVRELESLEDNMRDKFRQYASEFGLIVVGYSGNDRSIMDVLDGLLRIDSNFPHGVYWCIRRGADLPSNVDRLTRFPKFHVIEISGFDAFLADLHEALGLGTHPVVANPFEVIAKRLYSLFNQLRPAEENPTHPVIMRDMLQVAEKLSTTPVAGINVAPPHQLLAQAFLSERKYAEARLSIIRELQSNPSATAFRLAFTILKAEWNSADADQIIILLEQNERLRQANPWMVENLAVDLIRVRQFAAAERVLQMQPKSTAPLRIGNTISEFHSINLLQLKRHQSIELTLEQRQEMERIVESSSDPLSRYGALLVLERSADAITVLKGAFAEGLIQGSTVDEIVNWPISQLLTHEHRDELLELNKTNASHESS